MLIREEEMASKNWQQRKVFFCERIQQEVTIENEVVLPSDFLSFQSPRVVGHRCSESIGCNLLEKPGCIWAGTNPNYDPLKE
jgi:hypothetical protein